MSCRTVISIVAAVIFGIACVSTDAFALRGGARGGRVGAAPACMPASITVAPTAAMLTVAGVPQPSARPPSVQPWRLRPTTTPPNAGMPLTRPVIKLDSFVPLSKIVGPKCVLDPALGAFCFCRIVPALALTA
jgi:hypothetical protein